MQHPPLYQVKAEFFRMLGHPVRIRVLELLQGGPLPVRDLLADIGIEASNLSQQLAILRRSGIVVSTREGPTVLYALAGGDVADLLRSARRILTVLLTDREGILDQLRQAETGQEPLPITFPTLATAGMSPPVLETTPLPAAPAAPAAQDGPDPSA
ncbi:hypothetical protein GCM10009665_17430 [Kitasatospora nipponensis]|uniref:HTH arsR-type domain-containing protein n=1 Tax=Kitasatospora nipponensis TaxID=258049 RepID=A0ABN1W1U2_9ACTN